MSGYTRGAALERQIADALAADGYTIILRSAGLSHGLVDVIAYKTGQWLLIQCKSGGPMRLGPDGWNGLYTLAQTCGALPLLAYRERPRGPVAYLELVGPKTGVRGVRPPARLWTPDLIAAPTQSPPAGAGCAPAGRRDQLSVPADSPTGW
jgi:Holliday junction resolvase